MKAFFAALVLAAIELTMQPARAATETEIAFPLRAAGSGTYLEDSAGRPFLVNGDTAWSLIVQLKREDVEHYLADRKRRGFNALLVNLIEHQFASNAPANAYGDPPFDVARPFASINRAYFDHADWVLQRAEESGFVVFLTPAYLGAGGGGQGWYLEAAQAGATTLERYGEAIARRFAGRRNIVWVHGGDYNPPDKALVRALAAGIDKVAPDALHTVHGTRETATADYWPDERWVSLDTAYTYEGPNAAVHAQRNRGPKRPLVLIEALYEGEHGTDEEMVRRQAYGALLAGAAGHFFGNNPIWHFDGPGLFPVEGSWREALGSRGAQSMSHLRDILREVPWWRMMPTRQLSGLEIEGDAYLASSDGSSGIGYLPDGSSVRFRAVGRDGDLHWIDPSSGRRYPPTALASKERVDLAPPAARNAAGQRDWVFTVDHGE